MLCDHTNSIKLKEKFSKTVIRLAILYVLNVAIKKQHSHKMSVAEIRTLK